MKKYAFLVVKHLTGWPIVREKAPILLSWPFVSSTASSGAAWKPAHVADGWRTGDHHYNVQDLSEYDRDEAKRCSPVLPASEPKGNRMVQTVMEEMTMME